MKPENAVTLLKRSTGETMSVDEARAKLDQESADYDPRLAGKLMAYAERERQAGSRKGDDDHSGSLAFR